MKRQTTSAVSAFSRKSQVTYTLPSPPYSSPIVTITLPLNSTWTSGLHWHSTHTEYLSVLKGAALITLHGVTKTYTPGDGIIVIPVNARHSWQRAEGGGEELVVREWTDPEDGEKEVFFRNLSSVLLESETPGSEFRGFWLTLNLWCIFWGMDNWPVFLDCGNIPLVGSWIEWAIAHFVLGLAMLVGGAMGLKCWYEEYTPTRPIGKSVHAKGKGKVN
jgi:mannose-6-phosphate isomerase-like protein (cupin superfamily)